MPWHSFYLKELFGQLWGGTTANSGFDTVQDKMHFSMKKSLVVEVQRVCFSLMALSCRLWVMRKVTGNFVL